MAVRIRLMRMGKIRNPQYRIVVTDARKKRDGRAIETIGLYYPKEHPSRMEVDSERVQHWLSVGAQPSQPVQAILRKTGDWQKFKGLTPPSHPIQVAPPKADRSAIYEAEAKAAAGLNAGKDEGKDDKAGKGAKAPAKKAAKKAKPDAEAAPAEAEAAAADAAPASEPAAEAASEEQPGAGTGDQG